MYLDIKSVCFLYLYLSHLDNVQIKLFLEHKQGRRFNAHVQKPLQGHIKPKRT